MSSEHPSALARRDAKVFNTIRLLTEKKKYNIEIEDVDKNHIQISVVLQEELL